MDKEILSGHIGFQNRTKENAKLLIYNRVPKSGSSMLMGKIKEQRSKTNRFEFKQNAGFWKRANSVTDEKNIVDGWKKSRQLNTYMIWEKHMYFIDVESYDPNFQVNWMNQVRDPIERYISQFYYLRSKHRLGKNKEVPEFVWKRNLNDCLTNDEPNCTLDPEYLTEQQYTYFCGSAQECRTIGNRDGLQRAKYNAEKYYSVIGVLEELELSFKVMELYLPNYFQNFTQLGARSDQTNHKAELDLTNLKKVEKWFETDIEFYQFTKQRLHSQAKNNGLL